MKNLRGFLGALFGSSGDEALRNCDRALKEDPRSASAWTGKGLELAGLGRGDEAVRCFDKALQIDPRHGLAWIGKGESLDARDESGRLALFGGSPSDLGVRRRVQRKRGSARCARASKARKSER